MANASAHNATPRRWIRVGLLVTLGVSLVAPRLRAQELRVESPVVFLKGLPFRLTVHTPPSVDTLRAVVSTADGSVLATRPVEPASEVAIQDLIVRRGEELPLTITVGAASATIDAPLIPGWFSILPPLIAIALALIFREVVTSLFAGVWLGALFVAGYNPLRAVMLTIDTFIRDALAAPDHAAIVIFSLLLGGMVGLMTRTGGTRAIVQALTPLATSRRRGQFVTWLAGLAIFFDDYANTLIVGNTMRPLTDRLKISREKLAYIVDSTAAPVAVLVPLSTWVGFEIGLIGDGLRLAAEQSTADPALAAELAAASPFAIFLHTIPYLFYPILAVLLVGWLLVTRRDFGPMLEAERRTVSGGGLYRPGAQLATDTTGDLAEAPEGTPLRWWNGAVPPLAVIVAVIVGLLYSGAENLPAGEPATVQTIIRYADPFDTLLWGSILGCLVAFALAVGSRILTVSEAMSAWLGGLKAMVLAMVILVLAWSLGEITNVLSTAVFVASAITGRMPMELLPAAVFAVAAVISFATGTSWSTMAILLPLAIPLAVSMGGGVDLEGGPRLVILLSVIASVMGGSIFGDHCSPISDTTVLSSMASGCDHVDHVRTQLPYALLIAVIALIVGEVPTAMGLPWWVSLAVGGGLVIGAVRWFGRRAEDVAEDAVQAESAG